MCLHAFKLAVFLNIQKVEVSANFCTLTYEYERRAKSAKNFKNSLQNKASWRLVSLVYFIIKRLL